MVNSKTGGGSGADGDAVAGGRSSGIEQSSSTSSSVFTSIIAPIILAVLIALVLILLIVLGCCWWQGCFRYLKNNSKIKINFMF